MMIQLLFMIVKLDCKNIFLFEIIFENKSRPKRPIPSKKYGCDMIRFTRSGEQVLHSSMKVDGKKKIFLMK